MSDSGCGSGCCGCLGCLVGMSIAGQILLANPAVANNGAAGIAVIIISCFLCAWAGVGIARLLGKLSESLGNLFHKPSNTSSYSGGDYTPYEQTPQGFLDLYEDWQMYGDD